MLMDDGRWDDRVLGVYLVLIICIVVIVWGRSIVVIMFIDLLSKLSAHSFLQLSHIVVLCVVFGIDGVVVEVVVHSSLLFVIFLLFMWTFHLLYDLLLITVAGLVISILYTLGRGVDLIYILFMQGLAVNIDD